MTKELVLFLCLAGASAQLFAAEVLPKEASAFIERRELCEHFRGEDPYDAERRDFLYARIDEFCTGSDRALAALREKYRDNPFVMERLADFDEDIEVGQ